MLPKIKVLVVDDSATMRAVICTVLRSDGGFDVVGEAADPYEAREKIKQLNPDVITLDIEMPRMRASKYRPVLNGVGNPKSRAVSSNFKPDNSIIAIGASTGGVEAIIQVLSDFPENCPPTVITQHMPASFLSTFADRLDRKSAPKVKLAEHGEILTAGHVYLSPGGDHHLELTGRNRIMCQLTEGAPVSGHRPSVDVMMRSVAAAARNRAVGVMLTGMGRDGASAV